MILAQSAVSELAKKSDKVEPAADFTDPVIEGKQAEFIVIARDVLDVNVESLNDTQMLNTYSADKKVYSAQ